NANIHVLFRSPCPRPLNHNSTNGRALDARFLRLMQLRTTCPPKQEQGITSKCGALPMIKSTMNTPEISEIAPKDGGNHNGKAGSAVINRYRDNGKSNRPARGPRVPSETGTARARVAIIGLGYVGLPLALQFARS